MSKKCSHRIVLTNEHNAKEFEMNDRRIKLIKAFTLYALEKKWISPEELFKHLKETNHLNISHLIKYAFSRND